MKLLKSLILACCYTYLLPFSYSARILAIFNFEVLSHFRFHEVMMNSLVEAGHHVTMIAPYELQQPHENFTVINSKPKHLQGADSPLKSFARVNLPWVQAMRAWLKISEEECHHIISLVEERNLKNFDVMFVELMAMYHSFYPLAKKMGIPVIATLSARGHIGMDLAVGNIRNPSCLAAEFFYVKVRMSFYERLINLGNEILIRIGRFYEEKSLAKIYENRFPEINPHSLETSLVFVNNHASFHPRALAPNVINIGGIHVKSAKLTSMSEQFRKFIEEARHGVVLLSLGSLASSDGADYHLTSILKNTFAKIPQRVIWKYNGTIEGISNNVLLSPWIRQKEILAHKNVLAFISHCGLSSTYEAIYFSKPMVLLPIFAEQPTNAALLEHFGVGVYLNIQELTEQKLLDAIKEIINDKKYHINMEQMSRRFKDDPKSPEELVVYWTEYVLRHKGAPLMKSVTADIPLYQYLLLDVFAFLIVVLITAVFSTYFITKYIVYIFSNYVKKNMLIKKKQ